MFSRGSKSISMIDHSGSRTSDISSSVLVSAENIVLTAQSNKATTLVPSFHISLQSIRKYHQADAYSELCETSKMGVPCENSQRFQRKSLDLRCLTGLWIRLSESL